MQVARLLKRGVNGGGVQITIGTHVCFECRVVICSFARQGFPLLPTDGRKDTQSEPTIRERRERQVVVQPYYLSLGFDLRRRQQG